MSPHGGGGRKGVYFLKTQMRVFEKKNAALTKGSYQSTQEGGTERIFETSEGGSFEGKGSRTMKKGSNVRYWGKGLAGKLTRFSEKGGCREPMKLAM